MSTDLKDIARMNLRGVDNPHGEVPEAETETDEGPTAWDRLKKKAAGVVVRSAEDYRKSGGYGGTANISPEKGQAALGLMPITGDIMAVTDAAQAGGPKAGLGAAILAAALARPKRVYGGAKKLLGIGGDVAEAGGKGTLRRETTTAAARALDPDVVDDVASAGAGTLAERARAAAEWIARGEKSSFFRRWAAGKGGRELPIMNAGAEIPATGATVRAHHGTFGGEFKVFKTDKELGAHFGTRQASADRIASVEGMDEGTKALFGYESRVPGSGKDMAVYIRIEKPYNMDDVLGGWHPHKASIRLAEDVGLDFAQWGGRTKFFDAVQAEKNLSIASSMVKEALRRNGYDGIQYINNVEDVGKWSYIVFNSPQIKSRTKNIGMFGRYTGDITRAVPIGVGVGAAASRGEAE